MTVRRRRKHTGLTESSAFPTARITTRFPCDICMFGFKSKAADSGAEKPGLFQRLRAKLNRGDSWLTYDLANLLPGGKIDDSVLDELETRLITADVGVETTERILGGLRKQVARKELDEKVKHLQQQRSKKKKPF